MIIRARVVVTMDGPPIENGAVVVARNRFVEVGTFPQIAKNHSREEIVDLGDHALLPGLINAHCHLDYTCLRGTIPRPKSFPDWIRAINDKKAKLSADDYIQSIKDGFAEAKRYGTTTIANLTAFPELVSRIESPIRTWWFAELIDVRDPTRSAELVDQAVDFLKSQEHWGLAPHAPFTASENLYRCCEQIAMDRNVLLTTHLAESHEEMEMFREAKGQLFHFLTKIGRSMTDCGTRTPVGEFLERTRAIEGNRPYLAVHLNELTGTDLERLAEFRQSFSVVHCPRSHKYFGHSAFHFQTLGELGFNVCLGTDSLASNDDLSLFAEMRAFQKEFPGITPEKILEMVTVNPARALDQGSELGKIRRGFVADMIAVPIERSTSVFEQILSFNQPVRWSTIEGRISA